MARCLILLSAACGVGKSTVKNALNEMGLLPDFACIDSDEVRLNWWTYKGTPREKDYTRDCLARAFELAGDKHLLFGTCNDPLSFFERVPLPEVKHLCSLRPHPAQYTQLGLSLLIHMVSFQFSGTLL